MAFTDTALDRLSSLDLSDPLVRTGLGVLGGAAALLIAPKLLKLSFRIIAGAAAQALPIVIAGLLAEKAAGYAAKNGEA